MLYDVTYNSCIYIYTYEFEIARPLKSIGYELQCIHACDSLFGVVDFWDI